LNRASTSPDIDIGQHGTVGMLVGDALGWVARFRHPAALTREKPQVNAVLPEPGGTAGHDPLRTSKLITRVRFSSAAPNVLAFQKSFGGSSSSKIAMPGEFAVEIPGILERWR
jgi:hypothetical protein